MKLLDIFLCFPRIDVRSEIEIGDIYSEELNGELYSRGLTKGQVTRVNNTLSSVWDLTVGDLRAMPNEGILMIHGIGPQGLRIIRILFGYVEE